MLSASGVVSGCAELFKGLGRILGRFGGRDDSIFGDATARAQKICARIHSAWA